jgi:hypothetical protein
MRFAFSVKMLQGPTRTEAYRILARYLPAVGFEPEPNDFFFQVNRRRDSRTVPGLPLNRISAWSKLNAAITVPARTPFKWPNHCYSALELDINTAPEIAKILPRDRLPELFLEMVRLGVEIAEHGDIP